MVRVLIRAGANVNTLDKVSCAVEPFITNTIGERPFFIVYVII